MGIAWRLALIAAGISAVLGVLEGLGITQLRLIASHESFWEFSNTCLLLTIVLLLVRMMQEGHRSRHSWH